VYRRSSLRSLSSCCRGPPPRHAKKVLWEFPSTHRLAPRWVVRLRRAPSSLAAASASAPGLLSGAAPDEPSEERPLQEHL